MVDDLDEDRDGATNRGVADGYEERTSLEPGRRGGEERASLKPETAWLAAASPAEARKET
jgi:hypothetical protein